MARKPKKKWRKRKQSEALTFKEKLFCFEYLQDLNGTRAYKAAGFKAKNDNVAAAGASRLLRSVKVQKFIDGHRKKDIARLEEHYDVTRERVLDELAYIGFSRIGNYLTYGPDGVILTGSEKLSDAQLAAVESVEQIDTEMGRRIKFKLHDKVAALDRLGRHLKLFGEDEGKQPDITLIVQNAANGKRSGKSAPTPTHNITSA